MNELKGACPLKEEIIEDGFDHDDYAGADRRPVFRSEKDYGRKWRVQTAVDTLTYNENEIRRIANRGF